MTFEIKIDSNALERLFPEGTEARVKLQQAVIQNFATRVIKDQSQASLARLIRKEIEPVVKDAVAEHFVGGAWGPEVLTEKMKFAIAEEWRKQVTSHLHNFAMTHGQLMKGHMDRQSEALLATIPQQVELNVKPLIVQKIRNEVVNKINAALEEK